ncbi:MAG: GtrA family protein [Oscillospiraceae bacterium]|nr:GtrA family protein [Oscillospiraceae bacterium]
MKDFILTGLGILNPKTTKQCWHKLFTEYRQVSLYIIFGALTTFVSWGVFALVRWQIGAGNGTAIPNLVSWVCAVTFAFVCNKTFVFESKHKGIIALKEAAKFYGMRLISLGFDLLFMFLTVDLTGIDGDAYTYLMKILATVIVLASNYVFSKFFIFNKKHTDEQTDTDIPDTDSKSSE